MAAIVVKDKDETIIAQALGQKIWPRLLVTDSNRLEAVFFVKATRHCE